MLPAAQQRFLRPWAETTLDHTERPQQTGLGELRTREGVPLKMILGRSD